MLLVLVGRVVITVVLVVVRLAIILLVVVVTIAISLLTCQRVTKPENTELPSPDTLTRPCVRKYLERYVHERRAFQSPVTQPAVQ